jgi:hypothetical protein
MLRCDLSSIQYLENEFLLELTAVKASSFARDRQVSLFMPVGRAFWVQFVVYDILIEFFLLSSGL